MMRGDGRRARRDRDERMDRRRGGAYGRVAAAHLERARRAGHVGQRLLDPQRQPVADARRQQGAQRGDPIGRERGGSAGGSRFRLQDKVDFVRASAHFCDARPALGPAWICCSGAPTVRGSRVQPVLLVLQQSMPLLRSSTVSSSSYVASEASTGAEWLTSSPMSSMLILAGSSSKS